MPSGSLSGSEQQVGQTFQAQLSPADRSLVGQPLVASWTNSCQMLTESAPTRRTGTSLSAGRAEHNEADQGQWEPLDARLVTIRRRQSGRVPWEGYLIMSLGGEKNGGDYLAGRPARIHYSCPLVAPTCSPRVDRPRRRRQSSRPEGRRKKRSVGRRQQAPCQPFIGPARGPDKWPPAEDVARHLLREQLRPPRLTFGTPQERRPKQLLGRG